ncbi:MAG: GntR family transcriptional regulator [Methylobacterium sp.]|jgi:DNA-binding GntR family transcriptional regulator|nr:GntR family transcriptional regulator [Methylobacterium sp.]MCA3601268.1 GntR family transcriptional regulator [Methylobacterium sp.]MCA3607324.1 GntR family transcriptional regulator [Methylobacterium sp.]MCA3609986.1 GntR family transcriptional regulator [Methylobacterium sp.]MCA3611030.1 GntR family transcriptional regulator [Methylobacterium sp.]
MTRISAIDGIHRRYLHDEVAERIRDLIRSGELEPNSRVNELELAERFGISRTPLREAIKILATEGMLELLPNRGARVAAVNEAEIDEMLEVIAGLEANAARLLAKRITDSEIADIAELHEVMLEAYEKRDEAHYFTLNRQIHEAMMRAAKNATLAQLYAGLSSRIQRFRYAAHKTPEQWRRAIDEHEDMLRLMIERDGEKLAALMERHILGKKEPIAAQFGAMGPGRAT